MLISKSILIIFCCPSKSFYIDATSPVIVVDNFGLNFAFVAANSADILDPDFADFVDTLDLGFELLVELAVLLASKSELLVAMRYYRPLQPLKIALASKLASLKYLYLT